MVRQTSAEEAAVWYGSKLIPARLRKDTVGLTLRDLLFLATGYSFHLFEAHNTSGNI